MSLDFGTAANRSERSLRMYGGTFEYHQCPFGTTFGKIHEYATSSWFWALVSTDTGNVTSGKALNSSLYWIRLVRWSNRSCPWNTPPSYTRRFTPIIRSN